LLKEGRDIEGFPIKIIKIKIKIKERERDKDKEEGWKKRKGRYKLKRGKGNNNKQYTPSEASDSKEGAASKADRGLTWPKRGKEKRNKIP